MKKEDNYKVNAEELVRQHYEDVIKKGKYAAARIVIEAGSKECIPTLNLSKVGIVEVSFLISSLQQLLEHLKKEHPEAYLMSMLASMKTEKIDADATDGLEDLFGKE